MLQVLKQTQVNTERRHSPEQTNTKRKRQIQEREPNHECELVLRAHETGDTCTKQRERERQGGTLTEKMTGEAKRSFSVRFRRTVQKKCVSDFKYWKKTQILFRQNIVRFQRLWDDDADDGE